MRNEVPSIEDFQGTVEKLRVNLKTKNLVLLPSRDNKQVGSGLGISEITVKAHRSNVK
jgi:hypothetical protein